MNAFKWPWGKKKSPTNTIHRFGVFAFPLTKPRLLGRVPFLHLRTYNHVLPYLALLWKELLFTIARVMLYFTSMRFRMVSQSLANKFLPHQLPLQNPSFCWTFILRESGRKACAMAGANPEAAKQNMSPYNDLGERSGLSINEKNFSAKRRIHQQHEVRRRHRSRPQHARKVSCLGLLRLRLGYTHFSRRKV